MVFVGCVTELFKSVSDLTILVLIDISLLRLDGIVLTRLRANQRTHLFRELVRAQGQVPKLREKRQAPSVN